MTKLAQTVDKSQSKREVVIGSTNAAALGLEDPSDATSLVDHVEFLDTIFADADPATETVCVCKQFPVEDGDFGWWNISDQKEPFKSWKPGKRKQAWYYCVSSVNGEMNEKGSAVLRKTSTLVRYHVLVLDDVGSKATPPPVEPTYRIVTSLNEDGSTNEHWGYALHPDDKFKRYEGLLEYCHANSWGDAGAGGCYRVMRIPGSANLKIGKGKYQSNVTLWNPDKVWHLDDLAAQLGCTDLDVRETQTKGNKRTLHGPVAPQIDLDTIDPLFIWLGKQGLIVNDNGGDFAEVLCPWSDDHTTGGDTAGYSPLGRGEGDWVKSRGFRCLHESHKGRAFKEAMKEWSGMGAPRMSGVDPLPWLQHKYTYIAIGKRVADLDQRKLGGRWLYDLEDWGNLHKGRVMVPGRDAPVDVKTAFLEHKATRKVTDTQYRPVRVDEDVAVVRQFGQELVNIYAPPNHPYTKADPEIFLEHVDFLLPDQSEADLFLNWLAYKIQNPASRSYSVVMVAEDGYGVGRSWIKKLMLKMLPGLVQTATLPQLIGKGTSAENNYNDWAACCQFLVVEEAKDNMSKDDFYHGYETFKTNIDTSVSEVRVNPKYGRTRDDFMFFNALILSNHSDALAIPANDRRVCVLTNPSEMADHDYYERLQGSLATGEAERVYWYLMERDISDFDHVYPPMTVAKQRMTEQTAMPSDEIRNHIHDACEGDLFTKKMLKSRIITAAHALDYEKIAAAPGSVVRSIWNKMPKLRDGKNGARYTFGRDTVEIRAIRNVEKWTQLDADRARDQFIDELLKNDKSGGTGLAVMK